MATRKKEVVILGGGFAGLSAGVELADLGHHVTLIERKGYLGGRAYSFRDPASGSLMDNGQHVLMGCYRDTLAFLEKIGTRRLVHFQKNLSVDFAEPNGKRPVRFRALPLPNPFHLLTGFLMFGGLSLKDKWSALRLGRYFNGGASLIALDDMTVPAWLDRLKQTPRLQDRFWNPLVYAALNDRPEVSSAELFAAVLREALFSGRKGGRIGISKVGLSDLYTEAALDFIEKRGGQILLKTPVQKLHFRGHEFQEVELEGGRRLSAEILLSTVPFTVLRKILPENLLYQDPFFAGLTQLQTSPIVAINLWFDRPITDRPFIGFWGTRVHWLFNKGMYFAKQSLPGGKDSPPYVTLVISGAREEMKISGPDLAAMALRELETLLPKVQNAKLLRSSVTKEPEATLAPMPGVSKFRPSQKTPYRNFFLAGDWTATGLPATIESAVRSAKRAVEWITASE